MRHYCVVCNAPLASNVRAERVSELCDACIQADPVLFNERYDAAMGNEETECIGH